jgi:uncharacterized membrane protein
MIDTAHVHPMLVHFPIVLFPLAVGLQLLVLLRGGDLAANACLANTALAMLVLGAVAAVAAAFFGDVALDQAVALGFAAAPLETHATLGISTMSAMIALSAVHLATRWFHGRLSGARGWLMLAVAVAGVGLLIVTAYFGGDLVYGLGVNVQAVKP